MKKRKLSEKEIDKMVNHLRKANCVLLEADNGATIFGNVTEVLALYAELTNHLNKEAHVDKNIILETCKLGLDMDNMFSKDLDKDLDKKLETIEKLVDILKDLRKGDK